MHLNIRRADINELIRPGTMSTIIGKRGTGKSFLIRDILLTLRHIPRGIVFSGTERLKSYYKHFLPDTPIYYTVDPATIDEILEEQANIIREAGGTSPDNEMFLVFDDSLTFDMGFAKKIFPLACALNITSFVLQQDALALKPNVRAYVDNVFLFSENIRSNVNKLWKFYGNVFPDQESFSKVFDLCTSRYECMVINRKPDATQKIEDKVFYYRAKEHPMSEAQ